MEYKFKRSNAEVKTIKGIQFGVISPEFIKNISVTQSMEFAGKEISKGINHDMCYDPSTGQPNLGAINDPRMGNMYDLEHPGYFGHIELVRPVYHVGFLKIVIDVLRCVSYYTSELLVPREDYLGKKGRRNLKEITHLSKGIKKCPVTQKKLPVYTKEGTKIAVDFGKGKEIINPTEVYSILEKISDEDAQILGINPQFTRPEWLLLTTIPVPPPHVRPSVFMSSSQKCDDDLTTKLNEIVKTNIALATAIEKSNQDQAATNEHFISQLESLLQYNVSTFIDNQHPGQPPSLQRSGKPLKTLRERLAGKDGRVRGNLMGKRVDFSARTVITADPNLSIDQVGVPKTIAMNLTVPETVTDYNKDQLLEIVKRGPNVHPGAKFIIKTGGTKLDLKFAQITELKNGWVVERHLNDGDAVLFNRQPSLHKMSIMGHKVKVLEGSTFRLNLACTSPYNADFDGDEMNLHVPQSLTARAEVEQLMMVDRLIVSPQANKPVIGIIQDSLLSSCKMTRRNVLIKKDQLMNMIMLIDGWDHNIPKPAIIKNNIEYWTGKQVFSFIIPKTLNIDNLKDLMNPRDQGILIRTGQILSGSIDKAVIGKSQGGLIHILFNDFGSGTTKIFLNQVQKISNYWIQHHGFTMGIGDAIANPQTMSQVHEILNSTKEKIKYIIENGVNGNKDPRIVEEFINTESNDAVAKAGKKAEESLSFHNNFKAAVSSGSKGSNINISQIMAAVGQQNVEGRRINYGFKHRTLPHFQKYDIGQESRGFVENSYFKGLTPPEFFFHAMAGREGLIDTACKTSETGYIQRRLVKALEDVSVKYDYTVRNSRGGIIQFLYGEDGLDATFMENIHIKLIGHNAEELNKIYNNPNLSVEFELIKKLQIELVEIARTRELNNIKYDDDYYPMPVNLARVLKFARSIPIKKSDTKFTDYEIFQEVLMLNSRIADIFIPSKDPIEGSERLRSSNASRIFRIYVHSELATIRIKDLTKKQILYVIEEIEFKFKKAIAHPGEMCGILAAQSIGEPATQMTLNTFHYAGVSAKNVTLGVPRLKELINVTKKLKTPSLTLYEKGLVKEYGYQGQKRVVESIRSSLEYKTLQDIIQSSDIIWSDDQEYNMDFQIIEIYRSIYEFTDFPLPDKFLSLRLKFSSKDLEYVDTSLYEISQLLERSIGNIHKIICSDDNTTVDDKENLFIRIIVNESKTDKDHIMITLRKIEIFCMSIKIKGFEGIDRVYTRESKLNMWSPEKGHYKEDQWVLETEGSNLLGSMEIPGIDQTRTVSNNVIEIYEVFGIEAARQSLLNELRTVLSFDGSYVNYRHLAILVDTMTCRGSLTAMTRHGINRVADVGTLTKCSFEETVEVLTDAAAFGELDTLKGISDNIMLGQLIPAGTGVCDLLYDESVEPDERIPILSREPTPGITIVIYIPSEPDYPMTSSWNY